MYYLTQYILFFLSWISWLFEVKSGGGEGEYVFAGIDGNTHVILIYRETLVEYEK